MPVFKVVALDRKKKVLVTGSNLQQVIDKGRLKLELADESHKLVLDEDGTVLDEDEVLLEVGKSSPTVTLMLLADGQTWGSPISLPVASRQNSSYQSNADSHNDEGNQHMQSPSNVNLPELDIGLNVWNRFPKRLLKNCIAGTPADPTDHRLMISMLADYVLNELRDPTRSAATRIAKHIVSKYPKTFGDTINGEVMGVGSETLRAQLYNVMQYRKDISKGKHLDAVSDENSDEDAGPSSNVCRKRDEYGCSDYQPLLPETESTLTQENSRLKLQELYASEKTNQDQILAILDCTYPTQRLVINAKKRDLSKFFMDWPCFAQSLYLIRHAGRLLGTSIQEQWDAMVEKKGKSIVAYFKSTYKRRERKRKSDKTPTPLDTVAIKGLEILAGCKKSVTTERSVIPATSVMFRLLVNHFQETEDKLFKVDTDSTEYDKLAKELGPYPVLIIQGNSFYDEDERYVVAVEECLIHARSLSDGILTVILAYYVFGYAYQLDVCRSLEFIQRVLLKINPKTGHKRAGKQRKSVSFDPKVFRLAREIDIFEKDLQVD